MKKLVLAVFAAAMIAGGTGTVQAADAGSGYSATIRAADLNLGSEAGLATFRGRAKAAANKVCGDVPSASIEGNAAVQRCHADFARAAEAQIAARLGSRGTVTVLGTR